MKKTIKIERKLAKKNTEPGVIGTKKEANHLELHDSDKAGNPHNFHTGSSQRHNTLQIRFVQVGCDPAKLQIWR
jgi:hypothetical protein